MNNIKNHNSILINLILTSIIPFLIWGPFFPDLIVSVSALYFLFYLIKKNDFYYFNNKPLIIFFIFCIYCILISIFVSQDTMLSFESSLFYFRIGIFSCYIWYLIEKDRNILRYFYFVLILCFLVLVLDGYFQYFTGANILGFKIIGTRVSSFFGEEKILGSYLSRLFPLLFALFLVKQKQKFEIYFIGFLFILVDVLIYLSGERSSFFFLNLSTIFIITLIKEYQKFRLFTFTVATVFVVVITLNSSKLSDRMIKWPAENMGLIKSSNEKTIFTKGHDNLIRTAYNMFEEKPIFGHGPKMYRVLCNDERYEVVEERSCRTHPHNFYIQLLAETGIIGFLFLLSAFCYVLFTALKQFKCILFRQKRPLSDYQVCLLAGILITVWPFSPNGNFFNNWLMIVYSLPVGFYLQSIYSKNNK